MSTTGSLSRTCKGYSTQSDNDRFMYQSSLHSTQFESRMGLQHTVPTNGLYTHMNASALLSFALADTHSDEADALQRFLQEYEDRQLCLCCPSTGVQTTHMLRAPPVTSVHSERYRLRCSTPKCNKERCTTKQLAHGMVIRPTCMTSLDSLLLPRTAVRVLLRFAAFSEAAWHSWGTAWKPLAASWEMPSGVIFGSIIKLDSSPQQPCTAMVFSFKLNVAKDNKATVQRCILQTAVHVHV